MKLARPSAFTCRATACCPLPLFADDCFAAASERRGRRCPAGTHAGAVGAARRRQCAARSGLASQNSLRSLRSPRSDSRDESDDEARCARRARPCAAPRPRMSPRRAPPAAKYPRWWFSFRTPATLQQRRVWKDPRAPKASRSRVALVRNTTDISAKAGAGKLRRASEAPRRRAWTQTVRGTVCALRAAVPPGTARPARPGLVAARAARIVHLTRRGCLNAESAANEVSSATRPRDRAPQGSRCAAATASAKRCGLPASAFVAPTLAQSGHQESPQGRKRTHSTLERFMRRGSREARWRTE